MNERKQLFQMKHENFKRESLSEIRRLTRRAHVFGDRYERQYITLKVDERSHHQHHTQRCTQTRKKSGRSRKFYLKKTEITFTFQAASKCLIHFATDTKTWNPAVKVFLAAPNSPDSTFRVFQLALLNEERITDKFERSS